MLSSKDKQGFFFFTMKSFGCCPLQSNAGAGACKYNSDDAVFPQRKQYYFWKITPDLGANGFRANPLSGIPHVSLQADVLFIYGDEMLM